MTAQMPDDDLTPSKGILTGLFISIWIWVALLLWLVI